MFADIFYLQALGWAIVNSFWQMALVWIIYKCFISVNKKLSSSIKSLLGSVFLIFGFCWMLITFLFYDPQLLSKSIISILNNIDQHIFSQLSESLDRYLPFIAFIYLILLIVPVLKLSFSFKYLRQIKQEGIQKINPEFKVWVNKIALQIGIHKSVKVFISTLIKSPVTIGFLKPIILLPISATTNLNNSQIEAILLHELKHIRRHDYLINILLSTIQTILYFNPFAKFFMNEIDLEREKACDELVLSFDYDPQSYVSSLLFFEKNKMELNFISLSVTGTNGLLKRIEKILLQKQKSSFNISQTFLGLSILLFTLFIYIIKPVQKNSNQVNNITELKYPFYLPKPIVVTAQTNIESEDIRYTIANLSNPKILNKQKEFVLIPKIQNSNAQFINFSVPSIPALNEDQLNLVRETVGATKQLMEEKSWKEIEISLAEIVTEQEKKEIKEVFKSEIDKLEWSKLESKLIQAYDAVDWKTVSDKLNSNISSFNQEKLKETYQNSIIKITEVIGLMTNLGLNIIPDTDISISELEKQKISIQNKLNLLPGKKLKIITL